MATDFGRLSPDRTLSRGFPLLRCIFCLEDSSRSRGVPHVAPEALGPHGLTLPIGAVCDSCNHYLGHELDNVLVSHPVIALFVQFLGLPGKEKRTRKQLGNVVRDVHPGMITIPIESPTTSTDTDGSRLTTARVLVPRAFSLARFRRALHHVGLNMLAKQDGVERVLSHEFDAVRSYIRRPAKVENWAYAEFVTFDRGLAPDLTLFIARESEAEIIAMMIAKSAVFAVDLLNTGALRTWATRELPSDWSLVGPDVDIPRASRNDAQVQYRISIELPR
jgi:hypothetical protein